MSEEEAFEHAIEMIQTRQMGFRKAADFFSVNILLRLTDKFIFNEFTGFCQDIACFTCGLK